MGLKRFLKPSKGKIALFVILVAIALVLVFTFAHYALPVLIIRGAIALVFWYLIACFIVWIYDKFRKRR